jgi:hypothetical protein
MSLSGTSLTVTTLTTAGLLTNNTSGQVSSVTGSSLAALLGGAPTFAGLKLSGLSSVMLKVDGAGNVVQASTVTDYQTPITAGNNMAYSGANLGTIGAPSFSGLTLTNLTSTLLKVNGSGTVTAATSSDYQLPMAAGTNLTLTGVTFATVTQPSFAGINCVTVGSQNVIYGTSAGSLLSGSNNILFGFQAAQNLTTGTYNTYIGTNASASSPTVTGELVISSTAGVSNGKGTNTAFLNYSGGLHVTGNIIPNCDTVSNCYIGKLIASSTGNITNEGVINVANSTATGRGANTMLINATAGLYSYMPAFWWGYSGNQTGGIVGWIKYSSRNMDLKTGDNTQLILPYIGWWEVHVSGGVHIGVTNQNFNLYLNGGLYITNANYFSTAIGWTAASSSILVYVNSANSYFQIAITNGMTISNSVPFILTAKFISL